MVHTLLLSAVFFLQLAYALLLLCLLSTTNASGSILYHASHLHHSLHLCVAVLLLHLEHLLHHGFLLGSALSQGVGFLLAIIGVSHCHLSLCGEMRQLCGTYLLVGHIGKQVVAIDLLVALDGGDVLFVLILLLVNLLLHLRHLLQLVIWRWCRLASSRSSSIFS